MSHHYYFIHLYICICVNCLKSIKLKCCYNGKEVTSNIKILYKLYSFSQDGSDSVRGKATGFPAGAAESPPDNPRRSAVRRGGPGKR